MNEFQQLQSEVGRLRREMSDVRGSVAQLQPAVLGTGTPSFQPIPTTTSPSVVNQIRNGELNHSVNTWNESSPALTADKGKECAFWFTHDAPSTGQTLDVSTTALTNSTNNTLKAYIDDGGVHSTYDQNYCDWDRSLGQVRLHGNKTIDAPFPNNRLVAPNRAVEYFGAVVARRDATIVVPDGFQVFAGVWDVAAKDWLRGQPFAISGTVRGSAGTFTERRYRVRAFSDRGFEYLSDELAIVAAPSDAGYSTADVELSWKLIPGILRYEVYRYDVVDGVIRVLVEDIVGARHIDNGAYIRNIGGYPSATDTAPKAFTATVTGDLDGLPADGDPWASLQLNIPVPDDYDLSLTTAEQVLRVGMTKALDRRVTDAIVTNGSTNLDSASAAFTALDTGRTVYITNGLDNLSTTITYVDHDSVTLGAAWPHASASEAILYIVEGGDHGLLLDAAHVSYVPNSAFAPHPDDMNRLTNGGQNPVAAPNHSSQGGAGGSGGGDPIDPTPGGGGLGCVTFDMPVSVWIGNGLENWIYRAVRLGEVLFSGNMKANLVTAKHETKAETVVVRVKGNWLFDIELRCSERHPLITNLIDGKGRAVQNLSQGDVALVSIDQEISRRPIRSIKRTGKTEEVGTFTLSPDHIYFAGRPCWRSPFHRLIGRLLGVPVVGIASHNVKHEEGAV